MAIETQVWVIFKIIETPPRSPVYRPQLDCHSQAMLTEGLTLISGKLVLHMHMAQQSASLCYV